jgi:regulator of RNase E activity RraA
LPRSAAAAILADGAIIAPDAIVLGVESGVVVIGVPSDVAGAVARAVSQRSAVIALAH